MPPALTGAELSTGSSELLGQVSNTLHLELPPGMKAPVLQLTFPSGNQLLAQPGTGEHVAHTELQNEGFLGRRRIETPPSLKLLPPCPDFC